MKIEFYRAQISCCFVLFAFVATAANAAESIFRPSLTEHGQADFQGNWTNTTFTPLERDEELGTKRTYTLEEAIEVETEKLQEHENKAAPSDPDRGAPEVTEFVSNDAEFIFLGSHLRAAKVNSEYRTSLVVVPENGRIPFVEDPASTTLQDSRRSLGFGDYDGPEIRGVGERCLSDYGPMPPLLVVPGSSNFKIVQTDDHVMLYGEPGNEARIIPFTDKRRSSLDAKWHGDSIARWENNTLVINTTNFHPQHSDRTFKISESFEIEERFRLVARDEIYYRYEVTDPNFYTESWVVENTLTRMPENDKLYEYGCHEGNYSLPGILAGARRQEQDQVEGITEYFDN
jgi:hypothetical protein